MDFTLDQIVEKIKHPEEKLSVVEQEELIDYLTMFIHELEEDLFKVEMNVDFRLAELSEKNSVAKAEILIRLEPVYKEQKRLSNLLKSLKSYRQNVRRKRDRIIPR